MKKKIRNHAPLLFAFVFSVCLWGCSSTIALFDQYAYTQSTSIKVDVLNLVDKSSEPYSSHEKDAESVVSELMKMREYEKHRDKDIVTFKMWDKMIDSTGHNGIVGNYITKWKKDGAEKPVFISDARGIISKGFDFISELESNKIKPNNSGAQNYLTK